MSFCIRDSKCSVYDSANKVPGYCPDAIALCQSCRDNAARDFNALRYDYVDLSQLVVPADGRNDAGKIFRPKPESKPPIAEAPFTLRGDIAFFVGVVARVLMVEYLGRRQHLAGPVREGYGLDVNVAMICRHMDTLASLGEVEKFYADTALPERLDGAGMCERARSLHLRARRLCGTEPAVIKVPGYCPYCQAMTLRRNDDNAERIWCQGCSAQLTDIDYARITLLQLQAARNPAE